MIGSENRRPAVRAETGIGLRAGICRGLIWLPLLGATPAAGQNSTFLAQTPAAPIRMERAREIALAKSAAPAAVSAGATVYVLERDDWVLAEEGTTGVACWVARSRPGSLEPHCFDAEGASTILPIHMHQARLQLQGRSQEEIDAETAAGLVSGKFRLPVRPAMSYMMSAAQVLVSDEGQNVGRWQPHLMIYYPYLDPKALGLNGEPSAEAAIVVDPGQALSNIMIVVREFIVPAASAAAKH
jgi:hypothetical protein